MSTAPGDGFRLDETPLPGGVTREDVDDLRASAALIDATGKELQAAIEAMDRAVDERSSWAQVALQFEQMVAPVIEKFASAAQPTAPQSAATDLRSQLLTGLLTLSQTPSGQRGAVLSGMLQNVLQRVAGVA